MKALFLPFVALLLFGNLFAQNLSIESGEHLHITDMRCGSTEHHQHLQNTYPDQFVQDEAFEEWVQEKIERLRADRAAGRQMPVMTIPIVFHVIHNNGPDNLAATYINSQIEQLNFDYRKTPGTSGDNTSPVGADTEIEFCPAVIDPNGNTMAEPGINRIQSGSAGFINPPYGDFYMDGTIKPATIWDPEQYFNVWVADLSYGLLGYAQFPSNSGLPGLGANGGAANTDGCVILYSSTGSTTNPHPQGGVYGAGRTLTHEAGHWLGLRHIWGDSNCGDDFCADTPTQQTASFGCPNTTTCDGVADMKENYMDYSNDVCFNIFTFDQKDRMQAVLMNSPRRANLVNSAVCELDPSCAGFSVTSTSNDVNCTGSGSATVTATGGTPPFTYTWSNGGNGATETGLSAGTYTVTISDTGSPGCDEIVTITIDNAPNTLNGTTNSTNETCIGADGEATVTASSGTPPYTYQWDATAGGQNTATANGLVTGVYNVTITDANGCEFVAQTTVGYSDLLEFELESTDLSCNGDGNGSASVTTPGSFNYIWNTGSTASSITGLSGGTYTVTVTEGNCIGTETVVVTEPDALLTNIQVQDSPCSDNNGTATAVVSGGTQPFTYNWNTGDNIQAIGGLSSGTYIVTITDDNNCTSVASGTVISENQGPVVVLGQNTQTTVSCNGDNDGRVDITVNGGAPPLSYSWSNGATTEDINNVAPGLYTIVVADANNCLAVLSVEVANPDPITLSYNSMPSGGNDGVAAAIVAGGIPPYSYQWSNGGTTQTITGLAPGTYNVVVTDVNGCMTDGSVVVEQYTGVFDLADLNSFDLYPNPSNGEFTIALDFSIFTKADIIIYNALGQDMAHFYQEGTAMQVPVNISEQAAGTYFVIVNTDKGRAVKKFSLTN